MDLEVRVAALEERQKLTVAILEQMREALSELLKAIRILSQSGT